MKLVETEVPDWAEWMAQNLDGVWFSYDRKPVAYPNVDYWVVHDGVMVKCGASGKPNPKWRTTLHKLEEK